MHAVDLRVEATDGAARAGTATTARGSYRTPCFMPVGTRGAIKYLSAADYEQIGAQIVLGNTYHLMLRPGAETVARFGGLGRFAGWNGLTLTDSGGYQVFSLDPKVDDDGVTFKSTYDGSSHRFTPELAVHTQQLLGADIQMVLDVCPPLPSADPVVRLAVEEGEVAVPGTFSRETGLLMTVADLSVILAKVQVDETDVVRLAANDSVQVTIDAYPDTTFTGRVTEISHSAKLTATQTASGSNDRAVDFDVEVTLDNPPRDVRPDLSCTARMVTDTRNRALSIPIIALTVRDHERVPMEDSTMDTTRIKKLGKEAEGVFVVRDGKATFRPVKVGIAGDEYFEVIDGLREGETIVAGTYQAIRDLKDGARVRAADTTKRAEASES